MADLPAPGLQDIARLLSARLGTAVLEVRPLGAGQWSRAFAFDTGTSRLVVRFGDQDEDFAKDRLAASWQQPGLPVPRFIDMGEAFGTFYAITERAEGAFLDQLSKPEAAEVMPALLEVLQAQRRVLVARNSGFGLWDRDGVAQHGSFKDALLAVATEKPRIAGWKRRLEQWPECAQAFREGLERLQVLADHVPPRHDVIHGDLLNRNVLVRRGKITAVFDWGSSRYGDHLYDIAWLTFCAPYTSGFNRTDVWRAVRRHFLDLGIDADDFDRRINCYELHIGLGGLAYNAFLGDRDGARFLVRLLSSTLTRIAQQT